MDPRRLLILTALGLSAPGCAILRNDPPTPAVAAAPVTARAPAEYAGQTGAASPDQVPATGEDPLPASPTGRACGTDPGCAAPVGATGRDAITAANAAAHAPSVQDASIGGLQVFTWSPGRVFEIWTAPLRVTTLTLAPGERLVAEAAGDTVRWRLGEIVTGAGESLRTHILLKPLEQGLQTNLVLMTDRRLYLIDLKSGSADAFNAAVTWTADPVPAGRPAAHAENPAPPASARSPIPAQEAFDARYRIEPQGRRPPWTPTSVFNDGLRTFITFAADLQVDEAPVLFVLTPDGEARMVNYRQAGGLYVVDRLFDRAELRLGDRRPQVVRIRRLSGASS